MMNMKIANQCKLTMTGWEIRFVCFCFVLFLNGRNNIQISLFPLKSIEAQNVLGYNAEPATGMS